MSEEIRAFLATLIPPQQLEAWSDQDSLSETGLIDSVGFFALINHIAKIYGVSVEMDEITLDNFDSIADIIRYVTGKQAQGGSGLCSTPSR